MQFQLKSLKVHFQVGLRLSPTWDEIAQGVLLSQILQSRGETKAEKNLTAPTAILSQCQRGGSQVARAAGERFGKSSPLLSITFC